MNDDVEFLRDLGIVHPQREAAIIVDGVSYPVRDAMIEAKKPKPTRLDVFQSVLREHGIQPVTLDLLLDDETG